MINVQRELKKSEKNWRAFEILNLGKYQRQHYIYDGKTERDEVKQRNKQKKGVCFLSLHKIDRQISLVNRLKYFWIR